MKAIKLIFPALLVLATVFVLAGCETESSDQIAISISPNNVSMKKGESREFTASGWQDYTWSLSDTSIGILSTTKGHSTVYTAVSDDSTNSGPPQVLTVTVDIASSTASNNVTPGAVGSLVSAEALISVLGDNISISPSTTTIQKGESVVLKALGPSDITDYVWKLEEPVHGTLSGTDGSTTIFTATNGPAATEDPPFTQLLTLTAGGGAFKVAATVTILGYER